MNKQAKQTNKQTKTASGIKTKQPRLKGASKRLDKIIASCIKGLLSKVK